MTILTALLGAELPARRRSRASRGQSRTATVADSKQVAASQEDVSQVATPGLNSLEVRLKEANALVRALR